MDELIRLVVSGTFFALGLVGGAELVRRWLASRGGKVPAQQGDERLLKITIPEGFSGGRYEGFVPGWTIVVTVLPEREGPIFVRTKDASHA